MMLRKLYIKDMCFKKCNLIGGSKCIESSVKLEEERIELEGDELTLRYTPRNIFLIDQSGSTFLVIKQENKLDDDIIRREMIK